MKREEHLLQPTLAECLPRAPSIAFNALCTLFCLFNTLLYSQVPLAHTSGSEIAGDDESNLREGKFVTRASERAHGKAPFRPSNVWGTKETPWTEFPLQHTHPLSSALLP